MKTFAAFKEFVLGKPLNALNPKIKEHIALIAIIAWVGLGADGLSSSSYGPEEAFLALGTHTNLAIFIAFATVITVFLISIAYSQVIELFPGGGGGYKVATHLLGPKLGAVSGSALIIDYVLTIAVSIASAIDALFSLLPNHLMHYKMLAKIAGIIILAVLNLRGIKESVIILVPLFLGFVVVHVILITIGIYSHASLVANLIPHATHEAHTMANQVGLFVAIALVLRAYSLGGGTYTGLEAVSNNVAALAEPKARNGKLAMLYMAIFLALTASGIIILYIIWHVTPVPHKTLNAVVFEQIIVYNKMGHYWLPIVLFFEAALLFAGANTGFLACPSVMANMAVDKWLPRQFGELSNRLVTQNGIVICAVAAILVLFWAHGQVSTLVIFYSINVFLTFSLSLLGLSVYWVKKRQNHYNWWYKLIITAIGFMVCLAILLVTIIAKFTEGAWITVLITTIVVLLCFLVRSHYKYVGRKLKEADIVFARQFDAHGILNTQFLPIEDKSAKTAVFFVSKHYGAGFHAVLWVNRLFPNVFKNFVFLTSGEIDAEALSSDTIYNKHYRKDLNAIIENYRAFCTKNSLASEGLFSYGIDEVKELDKLAKYVEQDYPDSVFFASKLVFVDENWWTRLLHNNTVDALQRQLHLNGQQMVILPMKI